MAEPRISCNCGYFFPAEYHVEMGSGEEYLSCPKCGNTQYPINWIKCPQCGAIDDLDDMINDEDEVCCINCDYNFGDSWEDHRFNEFEELPDVICPKCNKAQPLYDINEDEDKWYYICYKCGYKWDYDGPGECPNCGQKPGELLKIIATKINKDDTWYICKNCKYESLNK
jgi:hypothetical protein